MTINNQFIPKVLTLYLEISQYPILSKAIRQEMRKELFSRGIISPSAFEKEVYQKALESQKHEGLTNPYGEESAKDWNERVNFIREHHTDFYFAYNLPHSLFEQIVQDLISRRAPDQEVRLSFNPELAPWDVLFLEGERYESLPPDELAQVYHHLREIKAVLIKAMISGHLHFVRLAREVFTMADLRSVREHRLGRGKIGGKAAGMLLAWKLLQKHGADYGVDPDSISIPTSSPTTRPSTGGTPRPSFQRASWLNCATCWTRSARRRSFSARPACWKTALIRRLPASTTASSSPTRARWRKTWKPPSAPSSGFTPAPSARTP
jgi:hypothetical protein